MLTFEQIKELIQLVGTHRLNSVEIERAGFRLKVDGNAAEVASANGSSPAVERAPAAAPPAPASSPAPAPAPSPVPAPAVADDAVPEGFYRLTSPIVGTFYRAPSPDSAPFVEVGDRIDQGQVLCIIEAMKLMNEIESDVAGEIAEILPQNGQAVEYGEPLFLIKTR